MRIAGEVLGAAGASLYRPRRPLPQRKDDLTSYVQRPECSEVDASGVHRAPPGGDDPRLGARVRSVPPGNDALEACSGAVGLRISCLHLWAAIVRQEWRSDTPPKEHCSGASRAPPGGDATEAFEEA